MGFADSLGNIGATVAGAAQTAAARKKSALEQALDMVGSKGGQTIVSGVGGALSAYGQGKQADADRAATAAQFKANMAQRQLESSQADQRFRSGAALDASPLGAEQHFAQKQALAKALLGGARNIKYTPGDSAVAGAMGTMTGGMRLPEGGLDPAMIERMFGDATTQASIAQRSKAIGQVNPHAPVLDTAPMFGTSADGSENAFLTDMKSGNQQSLNQQMNESAEHRALVQQAMAEDAQTGKPGGSSIWKKIAKIGLALAPVVAAPFTGGASLLAIGAGAGAASGALSGGVKGALLGGAMGAIPGGSAAKAGSSAAAQMAKNPALYTALLKR